ncbi:GNAT family N-acetyltransferase [Myroides sp. LJL119]
MRQPILTERFILREIQACDLQGMFDLDNDPLVHKYLQEPIVSTLDQAKQVIDFITKQYSDNKIGR